MKNPDQKPIHNMNYKPSNYSKEKLQADYDKERKWLDDNKYKFASDDKSKSDEYENHINNFRLTTALLRTKK